MKNIFPPLQWLPGYNLKTLSSDALAGIVLTAYAIPVSLAYATLAGLPPVYGIYGYLLGGFFYAILGTGKQLAVGPTSAISMVIGVTLLGLAGEEEKHIVRSLEEHTVRLLELASLTALLLAGMSVLAYFLRLDSLINFISENVLTGFKAGAALTIMVSQLPKLFGVLGPPINKTDFFSRCGDLVGKLDQLNVYVLIFGIIAFIIIFGGEKLFPGKPIAIYVVILSILLISLSPLGDKKFDIVGSIPASLPKFHIPKLNWADIKNVGFLASACFLLAYIESVSAARTLAQKNGYEINPHQELLALGLANLATSFGNGYPVSGGLSQSAVNDGAGAKTPMALVFTSFFIGICLLFLAGLLFNLPKVILASIVFVAVIKLINIKEFQRMWKVNKFDFIIAMLAGVSVLAFGILQGVMIGALASLILIIKFVSSPHVAILGRIPGTERYTDIKRHPDNQVTPGILLFRVESPLVYFNVNYVYSHIWPIIVKEFLTLKIVIFDLSTSAYIDSSGARLIKKLYLNLESKGVIFKVAEAHSEVRDILRFEDIEHLLGHVSRRDSIHDVITNTLTEEEMREKIREESV
ncbi:MAG: sulfate permease [Bacteroidia bacterium]|nr:sulfate permease [Bacteroidia bacterium]